MKGKPVKLTSKSFNSISEAKNFFISMLGKYQNGETISSKDSELLLELLERHPDKKQKIGCGIDLFYKDKSQEQHHKTSCFHIKRIDGSKTEFGLNPCLNGHSSSSWSKFYNACCSSVAEKLREQKKTEINKLNTKNSKKLTLGDFDYVHDSPLFKDIVKDFINLNNICLDKVRFSGEKDLEYGLNFEDQGLAEKFNEYHSDKAVLKLVNSRVKKNSL